MEIKNLLSETLRYTQTRMVHIPDEPPRRIVTPVLCYNFDQDDNLMAPFGYYRRIEQTLKAAGYHCQRVDETKPTTSDTYKSFFAKAVEGVELRYRQDEYLARLATSLCGRFDCAPGYGKTMLILMACRLFMNARIDVVTSLGSVIRKIFDRLDKACLDASLWGAGGQGRRSRIQCYCAKSLHHATGDADIVLADEVHLLAAESYLEKLCVYRHARMFGFSATHNMRKDGKDFELEGLFGPVLMKVSYQEAQAHGMVSAITVKWRVVSVPKPAVPRQTPDWRARCLIWRHLARNRLVVKDATSYSKDTQVLIIVNTVEHGIHLLHLLRQAGVPDFELVYNEGKFSSKKGKKQWSQFLKAGLLRDSDKPLNLKRRLEIEAAFESGKIKRAIATSVWNTGVDFPSLDVIVRAGVLESAILDTQEGARPSRTTDTKQTAIIHDYLDNFDATLARKSVNRRRNYAKLGWTQEVIQDGEED